MRNLRTAISVFGVLFLCDCAASEFDLPNYESIKVGAVVLSTAQVEVIRSELKKSRFVECELYEKPEYVIEGKRSGAVEPEYFSVWARERLVYPGYFLDGWTERMRGEKSKCLKVSDRMIKLLEKPSGV